MNPPPRLDLPDTSCHHGNPFCDCLHREMRLRYEAHLLKSEAGNALYERDAAEARIAELEAQVAGWTEKARNWLASPEAARRLDGYLELGGKCASLEARVEEMKAAILPVLERWGLHSGLCVDAANFRAVDCRRNHPECVCDPIVQRLRAALEEKP